VKLSIANPTSSNLFILLAIGLFGGSIGPICVRYALSYNMSPDVITALRMGFTAIVFTPFVWSQYHRQIRNMQPRHIASALIAGCMFGVSIIVMVTSLQHIGIMINQVLIGTSPIWVAVLEVTILKTKLNRYVWLGIIIAFLGGTIIALSASGEPAIIEGGNATYGVILALISAIGASIYLIMGRKFRADIPFVPYIWLVYVGGAAITLVITIINQSPLTGYDPQAYFWIIMLAIVAQIIAHGSFNFVLGYLQATTVSVSGQSVPILSAIWAFLVFSESPTLLQIIGSIVIILGVIMVIRAQNQAKEKLV